MLVSCHELQIDFLMCSGCLRVYDIVIEGDRLVFVDSTDVPRIASADTDFSVRHELVLAFHDCDLPNGATDLNFFRADMLKLSEETHFEFACCLIDFEELLERLFEDRITETVSHYVVAASAVETRFHFEDTDLIKGSYEKIYYNTCLLSTD